MISILLVDDSRLFLACAREFLADQPGLAVVGQATSGREAVEKAIQLRPDLVLTDIAMPDMNGFEVTRLIKTSLPGVRMIVLTLHDTDEYRAASLEAAADGFVAKSSLVVELAPAIRTVFPAVVP